MKKRILLIAVLFLVLAGIYIIGSGFVKSTSAFISDFSVSDDGSEMSISVSTAASAGYIRKVSVHQQHGGKLYLDCYCAFGGFNGAISARQDYTVPIAGDTEIIAVYKSLGCYETQLKKENGVWMRAH